MEHELTFYQDRECPTPADRPCRWATFAVRLCRRAVEVDELDSYPAASAHCAWYRKRSMSLRSHTQTMIMSVAQQHSFTSTIAQPQATRGLTSEALGCRQPLSSKSRNNLRLMHIHSERRGLSGETVFGSSTRANRHGLAYKNNLRLSE